MCYELELLEEQLKIKTLTVVAKELDTSKSTLSRVRKEDYPNPLNIYHKIKMKYGKSTEIVGVGTSKSAKEVFDEIMEMTDET